MSSDNKKMNVQDINQVEKILCKSLNHATKHSIHNLNQVPQQLIDEIRLLPVPLNYKYLQYHIAPSENRYLKLFFQHVVEEGIPANKWLIGQILTPKYSLAQLLSQDVTAILSVLEPSQDEGWGHFPPTYQSWTLRQFSRGAPAVLRPEIDYHWRSPTHIMGFDMLMKASLVPITDVFIATRRWLGSIVARHAEDKNLLNNSLGADELVKQICPEVHDLSNDARIGIEAMLMELSQINQKNNQIPGFCGPDSWYAGHLIS